MPRFTLCLAVPRSSQHRPTCPTFPLSSFPLLLTSRPVSFAVPLQSFIPCLFRSFISHALPAPHTILRSSPLDSLLRALLGSYLSCPTPLYSAALNCLALPCNASHSFIPRALTSPNTALLCCLRPSLFVPLNSAPPTRSSPFWPSFLGYPAPLRPASHHHLILASLSSFLPCSASLHTALPARFSIFFPSHSLPFFTLLPVSLPASS